MDDRRGRAREGRNASELDAHDDFDGALAARRAPALLLSGEGGAIVVAAVDGARIVAHEVSLLSGTAPSQAAQDFIELALRLYRDSRYREE